MYKIKNMEKLTSSTLKDIRHEAKRFLDHLETFNTDRNNQYYYEISDMITEEMDLIQEINRILYLRKLA